VGIEELQDYRAMSVTDKQEYSLSCGCRGYDKTMITGSAEHPVEKKYFHATVTCQPCKVSEQRQADEDNAASQAEFPEGFWEGEAAP